MIYGPGFAEALVTITLVCRGIFLLEKLDKNAEILSKWKEVPQNRVLAGILVCSVCTCMMAWADVKRGYYLRVLLLGVVSGGLLAAWVMDVETHLIYNYVWYLSGFAALSLLIFSGNFKEVWLDILCFILLQQLLFGRMYGRADCHAFSVCALAQGAFGMNMQEYLLQMLIAFLLLAAVQLVKSNVTGEGRLKISIPFLPYITVSFWILLFGNQL